MRRASSAAILGVSLLLSLAAAAAEPAAVPLPDAARKALAVLGNDVVGEALPAPPIVDPSKLRHLEPGTWTYRIEAGAHRGQDQVVRVDPLPSDGHGPRWRVVTDGDDVQTLVVTTDHAVVKERQTDLQSDRTIVYRPGLVLEPGMAPGESKTVEAVLETRKQSRPGKVEYQGSLSYTIHYIGMYRVTTPAGTFAARLLEHRYAMKIGPATANYHSYGFYADDVGNVAEVSEESVNALLVYRRSSESARVLLSAPGT